MNALTQYRIRQAALEVKAYNPLAQVFVPDEPEWQEVVDSQAFVILDDCCTKTVADTYANDFEVLRERGGEIINRVADTYAAIKRRWPDAKARKDELSALGAEILRIVMEDLRKAAQHQLEREQ